MERENKQQCQGSWKMGKEDERKACGSTCEQREGKRPGRFQEMYSERQTAVKNEAGHMG